MSDQTRHTVIDTDKPLLTGKALAGDRLNRKEFARSVVTALQRVTSSSGFVLSVEGSWGSGKTSTLAMIEEVLQEDENRTPVIVRFNPWLIGNRDALLGQFLSKIAESVKLTDHAKNAKKVAKELKNYSKVFDVVKLIPGAEPWASIVKSVMSSVGEATYSASEQNECDIEAQKRRVEEALSRFPRPIIVFIDDVDRLFPQEVFEMVRIIKAVGDLPNVGYVLAWDHRYIIHALRSASVPQSDGYLDKIVQVRMPLPGLSLTAKETLIDEALKALHPEAMDRYFASDENRLSMLYFSGLRDVLEQPRDVTRVFNSVGMIEPALRGEIALSDIVGLATLMVKAPPVFELLRNQPRWFVGLLPIDNALLEKSEDILKAGKEHRDAAYAQCSQPDAVRRLVHYLFPQTAKAEDTFTMGHISDVEGHLAAPNRLLVALQLSVSPTDVSLRAARRYLLCPESREDVVRALNARNCLEFLSRLGDVAESMNGRGIDDLEDVCVSIARLVDTPLFVERAAQSVTFSLSPEDVAERAIGILILAVAPDQKTSIAASIIKDRKSLSVAMQISYASYLSHERNDKRWLITEEKDKEELVQSFTGNVLAAAKEGTLLKTCNAGFILWNVARLAPIVCPQIFKELKRIDHSLDGFALEILHSSTDSSNGRAYALPKDLPVLEAYCSLETLRRHAVNRLADTSIDFPAKAAWHSVVEKKSFYGKDGSICER